ncbi:MAG: hypothetical protein IJD96_11685 [Lachnospiraceae bacterium]|nr:hypothetical protein [Lachnospiraceae bacterium]
MAEFLNMIFGEVDYSTVTPLAIVCIYAFSLVLECIASIFQSTLKVGGLN